MKKILLLLYSIVFILSSQTLAQNCAKPNDDFGANLWNVRVFQLTNLSNYRSANQYDSRNNYKGYYTQKIDGTGHFGAKTTLQWAANASTRPTAARAFYTSVNNYGTAYSGCNLTSQNFLFTHKRKGFPINNYELFFDIWDDKTAVYLDGREISDLAQFGSNRMSKFCLYLDENSELEIRTDNSGGDMSQLSFRLVPSTAIITITPDLSICTGENLTIAVSATSTSGANLNNLFTNSTWTWQPESSTNMITRGGNLREATVNTFNHGNYKFTYSGRFEECDVNQMVNVLINPEAGDTSVFGDKSWNVFGFGNASNTPNTDANYLRNNLIYYGNYTQVLRENSNYGFNTTQIATGGWSATGRPSHSNTWQGCPMPSNDNFTYIHKRQGFPCATYSLKLTRRGDNTKIYINGVLIGPVNSTECNNNCAINLGEFNLDANSKIEVRTNERTGSAQSILEITPIISNDLARDNDVKTCPVRGNQWVDFYEVNGRYLGSVRGATPDSDLGNVTMTTFVDAAGLLVPACTNTDDLTAVMQRHWVIQPTINGAGQVRLPYTDTEFSNLAEMSSLSTNPHDLVSYPMQSTVKLSKFSGPENVNRSPFDNCEVGGTTIHEQSNSMFRSTGFLFQEFSVPGFSEFWLHGSNMLTPLPTEMTNYEISCENENTIVEWSAVINNAIAGIIVDRSVDGQQWEEVFYYANNKQGIYTKYFEIMDDNSRPYYYRISSLDKGNNKKVHKVLLSNCKSEANEEWINAFPNPANDKLTITGKFSSNEGQGILMLSDMQGKPVFEFEMNELYKTKSIEVDVTFVPAGIYLVRVVGNDVKIQPIKVVIQ